MRRGTLCVIGLAAMSCGDVVFVDPAAALKAKLILTSVEQLQVVGDPRIYFHVRVGSREGIDRIVLRASGLDGAYQVPLDRARRQPCGDTETCLSITLGPGPFAVDRMTLSVPELGHEVSAAIAVRALAGYEVVGEAAELNSKVSVRVDDPIRRYYLSPERVTFPTGMETAALLFPRNLDAHVAPGPCGAPPDPSDPGWARLTASPALLPAEFQSQADPQACVTVRPSEPERGPAVASATVPGRAHVSRFRHVYAPPVELAPLVFMPIFDLEIPNQARCVEAQNLIRLAVHDAATRIAASIGAQAEVLELPALQIAQTDGVPCRQSNVRSFDGVAEANRAKARIDAAFGPNRRVRLLFVYAQNLDLALPPALDVAFVTLRDEFRASRTRPDFMFAIAPERAAQRVQLDRQIEWVATEEPMFRQAIENLLTEVWPFQTVVHAPDTVVPLASAQQQGRWVAYRLCSASVPVDPLGRPAPGGRAIEPSIYGPAYRVTLPEQVLVTRTELVVPRVTVQWEGCERLCDRPGPGADPQIPWLEASGC